MWAYREGFCYSSNAIFVGLPYIVLCETMWGSAGVQSVLRTCLLRVPHPRMRWDRGGPELLFVCVVRHCCEGKVCVLFPQLNVVWGHYGCSTSFLQQCDVSGETLTYNMYLCTMGPQSTPHVQQVIRESLLLLYVVWGCQSTFKIRFLVDFVAFRPWASGVRTCIPRIRKGHYIGRTMCIYRCSKEGSG